MRRRLIPALLVLFASGVVWATALAPRPAQADGFAGAGSTFAHPILAKWGREFTGQEGEGGAVVAPDGGMDYEPIGSLGGMMRVVQREVDFGATDVPFTPEDLAKRGLDQFPFVTGGVAVVVNVKGVASGALRLSGPALARMYLGEITRWNAAELIALNPGLALPDAPIIVVRRSDGSGTTYHFAAYLAAASEDWRKRVGVDTLLVWPTGTPAKGNAELAERVKSTDNAIGYVEASQAARLRLAVALIGNKAGNFVAPSPASLQAAAATASWDASRHFHSAIVEPTDAGAYPITATVFALMPRPLGATARSRRTLAFFNMALTERAADAAQLGYVPLPDALVSQVVAYWRTAPARLPR